MVEAVSVQEQLAESLRGLMRAGDRLAQTTCLMIEIVFELGLFNIPFQKSEGEPAFREDLRIGSQPSGLGGLTLPPDGIHLRHGFVHRGGQRSPAFGPPDRTFNQEPDDPG